MPNSEDFNSPKPESLPPAGLNRTQRRNWLREHGQLVQQIQATKTGIPGHSPDKGSVVRRKITDHLRRIANTVTSSNLPEPIFTIEGTVGVVLALATITSIPIWPTKCILWGLAWVLLSHVLIAKFIKKRQLVAFLVVSVCALVAFVPKIRSAWTEEMASKTDGVLIQPQGDKKDARILIRIGGSSAIIENNVTNPQATPVFSTDDSMVYVWKESGLYHISATIRDEDGKMVLQIIDNHWSTGAYPVWDKNYDKNSLEVKDAKGRVVFQVMLLPNILRFQARILNGYGQECEYRSNGDGADAEVDIRPTNKNPINKPITPLFKYPSRENWRTLASPIKEVANSKIYPTNIGFACVGANSILRRSREVTHVCSAKLTHLL